MGYSVNIENVQAAAQRLNGVVKRTTVVSSEDLNRIAGREVLLKCENLPSASLTSPLENLQLQRLWKGLGRL